MPEWKEGYVRYYELEGIVQLLRLHCEKFLEVAYQGGSCRVMMVGGDDRLMRIVREAVAVFEKAFDEEFARMAGFACCRLEGIREDWLLVIMASQ